MIATVCWREQSEIASVRFAAPPRRSNRKRCPSGAPRLAWGRTSHSEVTSPPLACSIASSRHSPSPDLPERYAYRGSPTLTVSSRSPHRTRSHIQHSVLCSDGLRDLVPVALPRRTNTLQRSSPQHAISTPKSNSCDRQCAILLRANTLHVTFHFSPAHTHQIPCNHDDRAPYVGRKACKASSSTAFSPDISPPRVKVFLVPR